MHIVIVSGSHRKISQSARISAYLAKRLTSTIDTGATTDIIDLAGNPLPLWDESMWQAGSDLQKQWEPYAKRLSAADGLIITSPEWHGMVPSGLKNFFLYASAKEIGHKPGMIVGVSSSNGGAYPVDELRVSSYKNSRLCYVPDHLIVRHAEKIFEGETATNSDDEYMRNRADYALKIFIEYAKALKSVRDSGITFDKRFPFGM